MRIWGILVTICLIVSCSDDDPAMEFNNYDYFPLVEGTVYTYKVDSYDYEAVGYDTVNFWLKEEIGPVVEGLNGEPYSEIYVYKKYNWTDDWQKIRTDLARNTEKYAERYTENVNYLKLAYPISTKTVWNAAPFNDLSFLFDEQINFQESHIVKAHDYQIINERGFDSTLHVVYYTSDGANFFNRGQFRERYANHVGLYKKIEVDANYQFSPDNPNPSDTNGVFIPQEGYRYIQVLVDYRMP